MKASEATVLPELLHMGNHWQETSFSYLYLAKAEGMRTQEEGTYGTVIEGSLWELHLGSAVSSIIGQLSLHTLWACPESVFQFEMFPVSF